MTTMTEIQHRPGFLDRPIGIIFILFAALAIWLLHPINFSIIFLAVIFVLLFFGLRRPVWAVLALLVQQFTILSYMVDTPFGFQISLQLLLTLLVGLIIWRSRSQFRLSLGPYAWKILLPAIALIVWALVSDLMNGGPAVVWNSFRDWMVGLIVMVSIPAAVNDLRDLKILGGALLIIATLSAVVAIMQHYNILGMSNVTLIPGLAYKMGGEYRAPGIAPTSLEAAYILSAIFMVILGTIWQKGISPGIKWFAPVSLLLIAGGLYFTYTRSGLIAIAFGIIALFFFIKTRIQSSVIMIAVLLVAAFMIISPLGVQGLSGRSADTQEEGTISREILWQAGLNIALNHPVLGIGSGNFSLVSQEYQSSVDPALIAYEKRQYWDYQTLGNELPHNDFINIWSAYGTPALIAFVALLIAIIITFMKSFSSSENRLIKGMSVGLAGALITYGINSLYHNMLSTLLLLWILAGFALALSKLAAIKTDTGNDV